MYRAAITNRGRAWLEEPPTTPLLIALHAIAAPLLEGETPDDVREAFYTRVSPLVDHDALPDLWREITKRAMVKVRQPAHPGIVPDFIMVDPPVEHFRAERDRELHGWGGKREGAGAKPRDPQGHVRVQRSITIAPDVDAAIQAARQEGESYSQTVERLIQTATKAS